MCVSTARCFHMPGTGRLSAHLQVQVSPQLYVMQLCAYGGYGWWQPLLLRLHRPDLVAVAGGLDGAAVLCGRCVAYRGLFGRACFAVFVLVHMQAPKCDDVQLYVSERWSIQCGLHATAWHSGAHDCASVMAVTNLSAGEVVASFQLPTVQIVYVIIVERIAWCYGIRTVRGAGRSAAELSHMHVTALCPYTTGIQLVGSVQA